MGDLGKLIVAIGFEKLPKDQLIAQSGHTGSGRGRRRDRGEALPTARLMDVEVKR